jgi:hypothetical protein
MKAVDFNANIVLGPEAVQDYLDLRMVSGVR